MDGRKLQLILRDKWGYSYDVQLRPVKSKMYFQVMWKYLEQSSFPLSEQAYLEHLNAVVGYLISWGVWEQVINYLESSKETPRIGKAISIPLDLPKDIASEWFV
ncbi:MAG: DUF3067 family protein [Cyanobacteriota bacterium ELA615]|jgi:hypothetical protein